MFSPEMLRVISQSQQSLYRVNFGSGVIFIVLGMAAMVGSFFAPPTGLRGFLLGLGLVAIAAGAVNCAYYKTRYVDIATVLSQDPARVVWVYRRVNTARVSGVQVAQFQFIVFGLDNRRQVQVRLPVAAVDALLQARPQALPGVTLGYSHELAQKFRQDPRSLRH
jgi:hypothetical protein